MPETTEQYFQRLFRENGVPEAEATAAMLALSKTSTHVNDLIKRGTDDFAAMQGRVSAADQRKNELEAWYKTANAQYMRMGEENQALQTVLAGGNPTTQPSFDTSKFYTKDDVTNQLNELKANFAGVIKDGLKIASRHAAKFGEELDVDAVEKLAQERRVPLQTAYELYVGPRLQEQQTKKYQEEREAYAKQKVDEYITTHNLPTDPNPPSSGVNYLHHKANPDDIPKDQDADLVAAWRGATVTR